MDTGYEISVTIKTSKGAVETDSFYVGGEQEFALSIFGGLRGSADEGKPAVISMSLIEARGKKPPKKLGSIACTLDEYAENCKRVARDLFKSYTLEH
jgi:hypothetical protein